MKVIFLWMLVPILGLMTGCAFLPRDAGIGEVATLVEERTGEPLYWPGVSLDEEVLALRVQELLEQPLSAVGATRLALLNNPSLHAQLEDLGIARADLVRAGLLRNPVLSATVLFPEGGGRTQLEFSLVQEFLHVVQLPLKRRVATKNFEQVKLRTADAALTLAAETRDAFYQAQGSLWLREIHGLIEEVAEAAADVAERLHRAGNITDLALAQEMERYQQARLAHMQARTRQALDQEKLAVLLGVTQSESLRIAPRLPALPPAEIDEIDLEERALAQRLDLAVMRLEREVRAEALRGTRFSAMHPDLGLGAEVERESDGTWLAGPKVRMNLPIFDAGGSAVAAQQGWWRQALRQEAALEAQIRSDVRQAWLALQQARAEVEHYRQILLPLHDQILEESQLHYNAMQLGVFDLLEAKQRQLEIGSRHVNARRDYWLAHSRLTWVVGGLLPEPVSPEIDEDLEGLFGTEEVPATEPEMVPDSHQEHDH
ncbi:TolC family protein [Geoalkalibacter halelectricus]|uniref:TolC family protein n=1 Tax=Geoalkalibacter halelectricus TaxID=2847045 RepID=UPI003D2285B1